MRILHHVSSWLKRVIQGKSYWHATSSVLDSELALKAVKVMLPSLHHAAARMKGEVVSEYLR